MNKFIIGAIAAGILSVALVAFAVFQNDSPDGRELPDPVAVLDSGETLREFVRRDVESTQPNLPLRVDEFTTWETIEAEGTHIRYGYRIIVEVPEEELEILRDALSQDLPGQICAAAEMAEFLALGGTASFVYVDATDREIASVLLDGTDCD